MVQQKKEKLRKAEQWENWPDEVEATIEMLKGESLDTAAGVFDRGLQKRFGGINSTASVFDAKAIFKTKKEESD